MAKKNLRERLRRYLEKVERRTNLPCAPTVVIRFTESDCIGGLAETGHLQAVLGEGGMGSLVPYELSPAEEAQRQAALRVRGRAKAERQTEELLSRGTKGTVQ